MTREARESLLRELRDLMDTARGADAAAADYMTTIGKLLPTEKLAHRAGWLAGTLVEIGARLEIVLVQLGIDHARIVRDAQRERLAP